MRNRKVDNFLSIHSRNIENRRFWCKYFLINIDQNHKFLCILIDIDHNNYCYHIYLYIIQLILYKFNHLDKKCSLLIFINPNKILFCIQNINLNYSLYSFEYIRYIIDKLHHNNK